MNLTEHLERRTFGRVSREKRVWDVRNERYPLSEALKPRGLVRRLFRTVVPVPMPTHKLWYLRRADQIDQGQTPMCVAASTLHWEKAGPICYRRAESLAWLYGEMKKVDGYPTEDGTDAHAAFKVLTTLGEIGGYYWYTGEKQAVRDWLLSKSGLFLGCYLSEEMASAQPDSAGRWPCTGSTFNLGHEMYIAGYNPANKGREFTLVQSWGLDWSPRGDGRFTWSEAEFWARVDDGGDLAGATEVRT